MSIEIYEQDKYATHVVTSKGEIKYECSARNVAEAIVKEHNKHNDGEPWHVGTTVTLVSAKNIAWRAEAFIDWDKVKTGKNTPNKCVKVTAVETQTNLQVSKPKVSATYLLFDGDKPENYMRWHATASDKDVAMVLAKQAAVKALMDSLADTALSAAESRHQSQAGEAHLLYALYWNDGLVGSMLRGHGLESSEIRLLMSDIPNRPLKMGEDPVLSSPSRHILHDAHDAVEVLRQVQRDSHVELLLRAHGIELPDHDLPTKNMKCYVTNGKGHKELVEIRVSKDGTKLGLYDTDGKALKQTGKE